MYAQQQPLMILRVEDKFGVVHILKFFPRDHPVTVAHEFGLAHGLDQNNIDRLVHDINVALGRVTKANTTYSPEMDDLNPPLPKIHSQQGVRKTYAAPVEIGDKSNKWGQRSLNKQTTSSKTSHPIALDEDPINNGEKKYIVGKRNHEKEL